MTGDSDLCSACGEPYSQPPTPRASICSNGFHCCRDCTWSRGTLVKECAHHEYESWKGVGR